MALDTEMVVRLAGKGAAPGSALEQALRQGDAGRDVVALHLLHGFILVLFYIIQVLAIAALGICRTGTQEEEHKAQK